MFSFHLYKNGDADMMTATFDLPDVDKKDVHVAFQTTQLTITWESTLVTERREADRTIVRERKERKYARTLPLPTGTQVSMSCYVLCEDQPQVLTPSFCSLQISRRTWRMVF